MARSTRFIAARDKRSDEIKTALSGIRNDLDTAKQRCLVHFGADSTATGAVRYACPWQDTAAATSTERVIVLPFACTAQRLFVFWTAGTGSGSLATIVRRNGTDTSLVATGTVIGVQARNRQEKVTFEEGDRLSVKFSPSGTVTGSPTFISVSLEVSF